MNLIRFAVALMLAAASAHSLAQAYPTRPLVMVVPYAPGGSAEALARVTAKGMGEVFGQNIVLEMKPGAGGMIGSEYVAKQSRPDGYTVLFAAASLATNVSLTKMPFDPRRDLVPVSGIAAIPNLLVVGADGPYRSVTDLIAAGRKDPKALLFGSSGQGTASHLTAEMFQLVTKMQMTHVPYKGSGLVYPDLMSSRVSLLFDVFGSAITQIRGGKVRALGVTSGKRSPALPDVPTFVELGYPELEILNWSGLFARTGTPPEAIAKIGESVAHALQTADMKTWLNQLAAEPMPTDPAAFGRVFNTEVELGARLVREGRVQPVN